MAFNNSIASTVLFHFISTLTIATCSVGVKRMKPSPELSCSRGGISHDFTERPVPPALAGAVQLWALSSGSLNRCCNVNGFRTTIFTKITRGRQGQCSSALVDPCHLTVCK
jgi:hypothetical protein